MKTQHLKNTNLGPTLRNGLLVAMLFASACASPEQRSEKNIDTNTTMAGDTAGKDTLTNTGSMSGSNGTGTDTTDMQRQKATRQEGEK